MKKEYDFSKAERGKFFRPSVTLNIPIYLEADNMEFVEKLADKKRVDVTIIVNDLINQDGTATVQYFTQEDGAVMLEPDVRKYFSTSDAVNKALRMLISIFPEKEQKMGNSHR